MTFTDQLLGTIDARIAEATDQITSLQDALDALRATGDTITVQRDAAAARAPEAPQVPRTPRTPRTPRAARVPSAARVPRRRTVTLDDDALTALLERHGDGLSAAAIAAEANAAYAQVLELLRRREAAGEVRRTGSRRSSLWRLVTDEERIAERAAELAARG